MKIKSNIALFQDKNKEITNKIEQLKDKQEINPDDILKLTPLMNQYAILKLFINQYL